MKKAQWKTLSTERLVEEFGTLSAEHGRDIEGAKPKAANRKFDVLVAIRRELRERGPEAQRQLLKLMDSPEPGTRYWVASYALEFAPSEAELVLAELAKIPRSFVGFTAELTLQQWKAGTFNPAL
ncbi:DUF2019 domain-containing protein [Archangium lansingense]|uniref:DUF2019 domain-containing protein n=1 Tax=Archangium lansingense TaxID=2995310 RepID=A0ABT3ZZ53_9BACT|nr:DUF2019 domain-containing protein [Archangium lansinium]MCY1074686.1 DUF2019 domain-containing protein [Archangium lansinium]